MIAFALVVAGLALGVASTALWLGVITCKAIVGTSSAIDAVTAEIRKAGGQKP